MRRDSTKVSKKKGAKQARKEDKKEAVKNKEKKRCENLGREKATKRQKHTGYRYRHKEAGNITRKRRQSNVLLQQGDINYVVSVE